MLFWFFRLPCEYLQHILIPFLTLKEAARMDGAVLRRMERCTWLHLLVGAKLAAPLDISCSSARRTFPACRWLVMRGISFEYLIIDGATTDKCLTDLMHCTSGAINVNSLDFYCDFQHLSSQILSLFLLKLANVVELFVSHPRSQDMRAILTRTYKGLKSITLERCAVSDDVLNSLADQFPDVDTLKVLDGCGSSKSVVDIVGKLGRLRHVHLTNTTDSDLITLSTKRELVTVRVEANPNNNFLTDAGLLSLTAGCPHLEHVSFENCRAVTDASTRALVSACPRIKSFRFHWCFGISDATPLALAKRCVHLHSVDLSCCKLITDAGMVALAKGCPLLQRCNVHGCSLLTDASALAVADNCANMEELTMDVSDVALAVIMQKCAKLRNFKTYRARLLGIGTINALLQRGLGGQWVKVRLTAYGTEFPAGVVRAELEAELVKRRVCLWGIVELSLCSHVSFPEDA